jgi:hypothetical protein
LTVIAGGMSDQARLDTERWIDEGGTVVPEATDPAPAAAAG